MGDGDLAWCGNCLQTINLGISIAIIVLTVRIYNFTEDNITILETFDSNHYYTSTGKRETQPTPASLNELIIKNVFELGKYCQCGEEILENICTEEQIISGCYDVSKNKEKSLLRNLDTEICSENIQLGGNPDFHKHFDLGFDMVYKMALGILIIYIAVLGVTVLVLFAAFGTICCGECALAILLPFLPVIFIVALFSGITNLVLFIIMMVNYYKGNTTGEFLDYYNNCMSDPKYKDMHEDLKDTFEKLDDLDSNFTAFVVLNFIGIFVNWLSSCFNKKKEDQ